VILLPAVYLFHRLRDTHEHRPLSLLHQTKRSSGVVEVLERHSELPLTKLLRMAGSLSIFYCFADYFWYAALANVSVAAGTAIFNCSPFFVYCFSICFLRERVSLRKLAGVLLSFAGVTLIVFYQNDEATEVLAGVNTSNLSFTASLLVVVSAAFYGAYEVAVRVVVGED
jgi:solute carrier family 35 protein F5